MRQIRHLVPFFTFLFLLTACGSEYNSQTSMQAAPSAAAPALSSFSGKRANYSIIKTSNGFIVKDNVGNGGSVTVSGVDNLRFADMSVNLRIGDKAKALKEADLKSLMDLYVAFFNRVPDADGLSYWIDQFNAGMTLEQIAHNFYQAAIYYSAQTGYSDSMSDADFVRLIYKNVLGRFGDLAPPAADVQYWVDELGRGRTKGGMIAVMLVSARSFANDATWGWVTKLLDNKVKVANYFAVQQGLNYLTPEESITQTMAIVAAITATDTATATALIAAGDTQFNLSSPVQIFTIATNIGTGVTMAPQSLQVEAGKSAVFTLSLLEGFSKPVISGCEGTLSGTVYTIAPASANCTITSSAEAAMVTLSFTAPHGVIMDATMREALPDGTIKVPAGSMTELILVPDHGYIRNGPVQSTPACLTMDVWQTRGSRIFIRPTASCHYQFNLTGIDDGWDGIPDVEQTEYRLHGLTLSPAVVYRSALNTTDIVVSAHVTGKIDQLALCINHAGFGSPEIGGSCVSSVMLRDDGSGHDKTAGDMLYTGVLRHAGDLPDGVRFNVFGNRVAQVLTLVRAVRGGAEISPVNNAPTMVDLLLLDDAVPVPVQRSLNEGVVATDYVLNIVRKGFSRAYDYASVARLAGRYLDPQYDMYTRSDMHVSTMSNASGYYFPLRNDVQGIGLQRYDHTGKWGLPIALQGMISFPHDALGTTFVHEVGHRWNTFYDHPSLLLQSQGGHAPTSSQPGMMGSYRIEQQGEQYVVKYPRWPEDERYFSDFELYTMGMMAPSEMQRTVFCPEFSNTLKFNDYVQSGVALPSSCIKKLDAYDIAAVYGVRTPAYSGQVLALRIANFVPSEIPLTNAEFAFYELRAQHFARTNYSDAEQASDAAGKPLAYACRGRCSLDTRIKARTTPEWPAISPFGQ